MILEKEREGLGEYKLLIFIFGIVFGSFNAMVVFRIIHNIPILQYSRSICLNCKNQIKWYHNIPLVSYILLKGRCANCNCSYSFNYFLIDVRWLWYQNTHKD